MHVCSEKIHFFLEGGRSAWFFQCSKTKGEKRYKHVRNGKRKVFQLTGKAIRDSG